VIGDLAAFKDERGNLLPGVAPVALQEGRAVAKTVARDLRNRPRKDFHYVDKGSLATIGRAAAVAQFRGLHISGYLAWLGWLFVHIFFLIGFRNRLIVLIYHLRTWGKTHYREYDPAGLDEIRQVRTGSSIAEMSGATPALTCEARRFVNSVLTRPVCETIR
jgi:NADH dehydrogenase